MLDFLFARHRKDYIRLAWQFKASPNRIYRLAHGSKPKTEKEKKILHEMLAIGIIHRRSDHKF